MKREIERKFLVHVDRLPRLDAPASAHIVQGYLCYQPSVRVRFATRADQSHGWITIKGPGMVDRAEYEYAIPPVEAQELLQLCQARVEKRRYEVAHEGHGWEIDEFLAAHRGLWLAEIELDSVGEAFTRPEWIDREVSNDPAYTNAALARAGRAAVVALNRVYQRRSSPQHAARLHPSHRHRNGARYARLRCADHKHRRCPAVSLERPGQ